VVAHAISVIVVQARGGRRSLATEPEEAQEAFDSIEATAVEALAEMRRLLGVLRKGDEELALAPQPSLRHLGTLVAQVREAGLPVELSVEGETTALPPGVDLSAYRIIQEALTNALKHAGPATARVLVRYGPEDLEVEVTDTGRRPTGGGWLRPRARRYARAGDALRRSARSRSPRRGWLRRARTPAAGLGATVSIRVLLADDERLVRAGFRMILKAEAGLEVIGEAADGLEAVKAVEELRPDVVLMDIRMPKLDGLEATRRILARPEPQPRVVVLTTFDLDAYVYEALRAGASGFLLKDAPEDQLVAAIRIAADGVAMFSPAVTRRLIEEFSRRVSPEPPPALAELTQREREVLQLLARGLSNHEIAADLVVSEHTAKMHVAHILSKLGLRDRIQAVVLAYESGLVQPGDSHTQTTMPRH